MIYIMDLVGVGVFAVTGALAAGRKRMDGFGVLVLAMVTAIGGGTTRDLLLGIRPVFWVGDQLYLLVALSAAVLTMLGARLWLSLEKPLLIADALGLSLFTIIGAQRAMEAEAPALVVVLMGVVTGVVGGIIRDILAGQLPYVFRSELYATAALAGAAVLLVCIRLGLHQSPAMLVAAATCLALRCAGIRWKWRLPVFHLRSDRSDSP